MWKGKPNEVVLQIDTIELNILPILQNNKNPIRNMEIVVLDLRKQSIYSSVQNPDMTRIDQIDRLVSLTWCEAPGSCGPDMKAYLDSEVLRSVLKH